MSEWVRARWVIITEELLYLLHPGQQVGGAGQHLGHHCGEGHVHGGEEHREGEVAVHQDGFVEDDLKKLEGRRETRKESKP